MHETISVAGVLPTQRTIDLSRDVDHASIIHRHATHHIQLARAELDEPAINRLELASRTPPPSSSIKGSNRMIVTPH